MRKVKQKKKFYYKLPLILVLAAIITNERNKHSEISNKKIRIMKKNLFRNADQRQSDVKTMHKAIKSSYSRGQKKRLCKMGKRFCRSFSYGFPKRKSWAGKIAIFTSIPLE